jgi:PPE-repeat protein
MAGSGLVAPISTLAPTLGSLGAGAAGTSGLLGTLGSLGAWAPLISSGISGLGSLIGGAIGSGAAKDAARTQADAAQQANILLAALYDQQRTDMAPYREAGYAALSQLGDLVKSPVTMGTYTAPKPLMATFAPQYPPSRR